MRTRLLSLTLLAAALVAPSCNPADLDGPRTRDMRFGARAPRSVLTKTFYSGDTETVGTRLVERLDWVDGDLVRILCDQASAPSSKWFDYDITLSENAAEKSYAETAPHGADHGLQWGSGTHTVFAMYPSQGTSGISSGVTLEPYGATTARATASLPADQSAFTANPDGTAYPDYCGNMRLAYMTAAAEAAEGSDVTLDFKTMVTTFYVSVTNTTGATMTLRRVALTSSSSALTGTYRLPMDAANTRPGAYEYLNGSTWGSTPTLTADNATVYASFDGRAVAAGESVTVALFALPHEITGLTLTVAADETGEISLPLKYNGGFIAFAGEKKHNVSNVDIPSVAYTLAIDKGTVAYDYTGAYTPDAQEFTVTSYKAMGATTRDVPWKMQVWVDDDGDGTQDDGEWYDLSTKTALPDYAWLAAYPTSSDSPVLEPDPDASTLTHTFRKAVSAQDVTTHEERLRAGVVYDTDGTTPLVHNSTGTALDLSCYDFVARKKETARYTANTYIIAAPGYYKIPLVFGNGIENDARMADSYSGRAARLGHLDEFICPYPNRNGTESSIHLVTTRPWLNDRRSSSARVHWEKYSHWDEATGAVTTATRRHDQAAIDSPVDNISITTGTGNERYIVFEIRADKIRPGNFLMSSLDSYGNVMWSWQIWITDQDMTPVTVNNGTRTYSIMPVNLGWTDLSKGLHYEPRTAVLRAASTERGGLYSNTMTVTQNGADLTSTHGWSTYYQWGRKDPQTDGITVPDNNDGYIHQSIKHPSNIMYDKSSFFGDRYYDWTINNYSNLWESKNTDYSTPAGTLPNHKTVYDPSPRRYCVPPDETFDGFTTYASAGPEGLWFPTGVGGNTVFFPAAGFMNYTSGSSSTGNDLVNGYWTYHPGDGVQQRASYCLNFKYNDATGVARVWTKQFQDDVDWISRAYGLSLRPVAYDETAVVATSDGTLSADFNFEEMTAQGHGLPTDQSLDGYSTAYPSSVPTANAGDFYLSFVSERDISSKQIRYVYDSDNDSYSVVLPDSYTGAFVNNYNRFTVGTTNARIRIVQVILSVTQRGVGITPDNPTFSADDATWVDSAAAYDATTHTWSGGQQAVTFTMDSGTGDPWKVMAVTVNYYVVP